MVFSVTLTWTHVVVLFKESIRPVYSIVETGISLMELDCRSLEVVISMSFVELRELAYIVIIVLPHYLVSIAVIFQLMLSMMITTYP